MTMRRYHSLLELTKVSKGLANSLKTLKLTTRHCRQLNAGPPRDYFLHSIRRRIAVGQSVSPDRISDLTTFSSSPRLAHGPSATLSTRRFRGRHNLCIATRVRRCHLRFRRFFDEGGDPYGKAEGDPNIYATGRSNQSDTLLPTRGKVPPFSVPPGRVGG